ncbi:MAG: 3-phosphoshikimate 1-carboxyvinyltransferase [Bacteroidota bacterium]
MKFSIYPFHINKKVFIPSSKSYLQRWIALASVTPYCSIIKNPNFCDDVNAALNCARNLGAKVIANNNEIQIQGIEKNFSNKEVKLNVGESGLSARMFACIASVLFEKVSITGEGSLLKRDMSSLINALQKTNCKVLSNNNHLPIEIYRTGGFEKIDIDISDTSQVVTGLLYTSCLVNKDVSIYVSNPVSIPYIQLSIEVAKKFGLKIITENYHQFIISANQTFQPVNDTAEGDWSNAAFFAVAAALSGKVELHHLNPDSSQGDKIIVDILKKAGAKVEWDGNVCIIQKEHLHPFEIDLKNHPDLFPPLVVLALGINGKSYLKSVSRLINKESNRADVLIKEFSKLGATIFIENDVMIIDGKGYLKGGNIYSYQDHRIAMAAAVAGCIANDKIIIENAEAVNKSYPDFFNHLLH